MRGNCYFLFFIDYYYNKWNYFVIYDNYYPCNLGIFVQQSFREETMKLQKLTTPLLALLLALCLTSCKDENPFVPGTELPPETTIGANTFGCIINGKVWRNGGYFNPAESLNIPEMSETRLAIAASRNVTDTLSGINIWILDIGISEGKYLCDSLNIYIRYNLFFGGSVCEYIYAEEGEVEITHYDLDNRIVSGRFNAILKLDGCEDIVITEGRFDLKQ